MTQEHQKLIRICTIAAMLTAAGLIILKFIAWYQTGSISLLSSLMDSSMDMLASGVNFLAMRYAFKPADHDHRFGHAKAMDLAGLVQAIFITYLSITIIVEAIKKFINPVKIESSSLGITIMLIALAATFTLVLYQRYVYKKTQSNLIQADSAHYITDLLSNLSVIIVLVVSQYFDLKWLDPVLGLLLAIYVFKSGYDVGMKSFDNLMDKEFDPETRQQVMDIIKSHEKVKTLTELKTRQGGHISFIQFDFTMDGNASLNEAHDVAHEIEAKLLEKFPNAKIFMHQEPA